MQDTNWKIGVCSWSLQSGIADVADAMKKIGIDHVHLAVGDALKDDGDGCFAAWIVMGLA